MHCMRLGHLFRPEQAVTGVAQSGKDIAVVVEVIVDSRRKYWNIRVLLLQPLNALRGREETHIFAHFHSSRLESRQSRHG